MVVAGSICCKIGVGLLEDGEHILLHVVGSLLEILKWRRVSRLSGELDPEFVEKWIQSLWRSGIRVCGGAESDLLFGSLLFMNLEVLEFGDELHVRLQQNVEVA